MNQESSWEEKFLLGERIIFSFLWSVYVSTYLRISVCV